LGGQPFQVLVVVDVQRHMLILLSPHSPAGYLRNIRYQKTRLAAPPKSWQCAKKILPAASYSTAL
jgi:hypothetical protein